MVWATLSYLVVHHENNVPIEICFRCSGFWWLTFVFLRAAAAAVIFGSMPYLGPRPVRKNQVKHLRSHDVQTNHLHVIFHSSSHWVMDFVNASRHPRTRTHTEFPSNLKLWSARCIGNSCSQTSMFHTWPPETTMNGKFPVQNELYLIIPSFRWRTNSPTRFYTKIHLPLLAAIQCT